MVDDYEGQRLGLRARIEAFNQRVLSYSGGFPKGCHMRSPPSLPPPPDAILD